MANGYFDDGTGPQTNTDGRPTNRPQTRTAVITGGTGGVASPTRSIPPRDNTSVLIAPQSERIPVAVKAPPRPAGLPHTIEDGAGSEVLKPKTHPERYDTRGERWSISAYDEGVGQNPQIEALTGNIGKWPELHPLLLIDGIVIRIDDKLHLVSQKTLNDIEASDNPHYDIRNNGEVRGKVIGETIPVIDISTKGLMESGSVRDNLNIRAGVKRVDYIYESDMVEGIPQGLIDHIHYIFGLPGVQRPEDNFQLYDFGFTKDFGIAGFKTLAVGPDGKVDRSKLTQLLSFSKDKVNSIMSEFNTIKTMYYSGRIPEDKAKAVVDYRKRAVAFDPDHEIPDREFVVKTSVLVNTQATPVEAAHQTAVNVGQSIPQPAPQSAQISLVGAENDTLIARWQAYGFTGTEKAFLKYNRPPMPTPTVFAGNTALRDNVVTLDGVTYYVGLAFPPAVCDKARFIGELQTGFLGIGGVFGTPFTTAGVALKAKLTEYFGVMSTTEWVKANAKRKAELIQLADKIKALEQSLGANY
jgi:hypothetical protein